MATNSQHSFAVVVVAKSRLSSILIVNSLLFLILNAFSPSKGVVMTGKLEVMESSILVVVEAEIKWFDDSYCFLLLLIK